jgi:predicted protein tyrosine phosphatase
MKVEKINIQKARELKKMKKENPELANNFYLSNDLFQGIIGKEEFKLMYKNLSEELKSNLVLISITEPDNEYIEENFKQGFYDVLETKFWDIEEDIVSEDNKKYLKITKEEGTKIKNFIFKNKNKKFLIHCAAGVSRSAGVACSVECIVNFDGNVYEYQTSYSDVKSHPRYSANLSVFDSICKD